MRRQAVVLALALSALAARGSSAETSLADRVEQVAPAVVNIHTAGVASGGGGWFFGSPFGSREWTSLGSGFVVDPDGLIVTNHHVVREASTIRVGTVDGTIYDATLIGMDPQSDLALLSVDARGLPAVELAPDGSVRAGDPVFALGNPYGYDHTVTAGIISAQHRDLSLGLYDDFLQTDASINPGNSGGPLFDMQGRVVGVNTVIHATGEGLGFAVPVHMLRSALPQLEQGGTVRRGWPGLQLAESEDGLVVRTVHPGGPAEEAGLREGDRVRSVADRPVRSERGWTRALGTSFPGSAVPVGIEREGREMDRVLELVDYRDWAEIHSGPPLEVPALGVTVRAPAPDRVAALRLSGGLEVIELAGQLGPRFFRIGDILLELDGTELKDPMDLPPLAEGALRTRQLSVVVLRDGQISRMFYRW